MRSNAKARARADEHTTLKQRGILTPHEWASRSSTSARQLLSYRASSPNLPACRAATCRREQIWGNQGQARRQSADQKEIVENEQAPLAIAMCPGSVLACGCLFGGSFFYPRPYTHGPSSPAIFKLA